MNDGDQRISRRGALDIVVPLDDFADSVWELGTMAVPRVRSSGGKKPVPHSRPYKWRRKGETGCQRYKHLSARDVYLAVYVTTLNQNVGLVHTCLYVPDLRRRVIGD